MYLRPLQFLVLVLSFLLSPAFATSGLDDAGQTREKLLAELEAKKQDALPALQNRCKRHEEASEKLRKQEADLRKNPRFGDPFNKEVMSQFNALLKNQRALTKEIQNARDDLDQKISMFEQDKRKILAKHPEKGDPKFLEHKGLLYTQKELDRLKAYEKEHADPRTVADSYMKSLSSKRLLKGPMFAGFFKNPKGEDSYAAAFKISPVNGGKSLGDIVHMYVFKDKQGYWQISNFSPDGVHVMRGPPPKDFQKVADPSKVK